MMARMCEGATTEDYRKAMSGDDDAFGLGAQWSDKPHRLVYDLCGEVDALRDGARDVGLRCHATRRFLGAMEGKTLR